MNESVERLNIMPHVKGHVAVDVMEHGHVVDHAEHDNYVSPFVYGALRKWCNAQFMMLHDGNKLGGSHDFPTTALNSAFLLTDYGGVVNPRERVIHGNILSYGYHQYVSNNANECSFNNDESYRKANTLRFVFDFSTNQGNGTFQSVYSGPSTNNPAYYAMYQLLCKPNTSYYITYCDGKCYKIEGNSLRVFPLDGWIAYLNGGDLGGELVQVPNMTEGIITSGNHMIWWKNKYNVYSAPVDDLTNVTKYTTNDFGNTIAYSPARDSILIGTDSFIKEYTLSMTLKKSFPNTSGASPFELCALPEENSIILNKRVYDLDDNTNSLQSRARWQQYDTSYNRVFFGDFAYAYGNGFDTGLYLGTQYFSRARLDKPVTKNSRQTMKITYDFNMPPIDWEH